MSKFTANLLELYWNSNVGFSSITEEEADDLEQVQKAACRLILKEKYKNYESALENLKLPNLKTRRETLALKFAKKCMSIPEMTDLFHKPKLKIHNTRSSETCEVKFASKSRLFNSAVPTLQRIINKHTT